MKNKISKNCLLIFIIIVFFLVTGCGNSEEKKNNIQTPTVSTNQVQPALPVASVPPAAGIAIQTEPKDVAVSVDGNILKKAELEKKLKEKLTVFKDKIPADKTKEARANIKKQLIDEFIIQTLLTNEVEKRKITATEKEIKEIMDQIQSTLPPDKKVETFMKENKISKNDIALRIKVTKMIKQDAGNKIKVSTKEISKFYKDNKDKFIIPENVHVRHILIAFAEKDDDKTKAEKKEKIENLRKEVLDGADFAEVARKNSDCPSKDNGGDLGLIRKGQTVKPFEDAAFSQELKVIGPVITTEYGYHVIQVLERNPQKSVALEEVKGKIASYIEQQKQTEVFKILLKKLRDNSAIFVYES